MQCKVSRGGGGRGCNVKSVALIFRLWVWARYCSMKLWPASYHAKYEPDLSSDLAIIAAENL